MRSLLIAAALGLGLLSAGTAGAMPQGAAGAMRQSAAPGGFSQAVTPVHDGRYGYQRPHYAPPRHYGHRHAPPPHHGWRHHQRPYQYGAR